MSDPAITGRFLDLYGSAHFGGLRDLKGVKDDSGTPLPETKQGFGVCRT